MLSMLDDYDWREVFGYAGEPANSNSAGCVPSAVEGAFVLTEPFSREDVEAVVFSREGENDGPAWLIAGKLFDGRWFYIEASCDYTGWDCQAGGTAWVADSLDQLVQFGFGQEARDLWETGEHGVTTAWRG